MRIVGSDSNYHKWLEDRGDHDTLAYLKVLQVFSVGVAICLLLRWVGKKLGLNWSGEGDFALQNIFELAILIVLTVTLYFARKEDPITIKDFAV